MDVFSHYGLGVEFTRHKYLLINYDVINGLRVANFMFTVPPDRLSVLNEKGDHIPHYILGPYKEGVTVDITCIASEGN